MHELSIANELVVTAEQAARDADAQSVEAVYVRLGPLSGVVKEALLFAFDIAAHGTLLAGARLVIVDAPIVIYCPSCAAEVEVENPQHLRCPRCDTRSGKVVSGGELDLYALEIRENHAITAA